MTKSSNACQSFRINAEACETFRNNSSSYVLFRKVIYIWVGSPDFREEQVEKVWLKRRNILFLKGFRREYVQIVPKCLTVP